jgi:hypothetical protein
MPITISFGTNAKRAFVSAQARKVIEDILKAAGLTSCLISSTARSPADQARIMFENIEAHGVANQKALYAAAGDAVIDTYSQAKKAGKTPKQIQAAMEAKIISIGPAKVSRHCADPKKLVVVDIAPSSIGSKSAFEKAVRADKRVKKFLLPPLDPAYHLEIPQA